MHIVSNRSAAMVGAEGKILKFGPSRLPMTFPGLARSLFQGKITFK